MTVPQMTLQGIYLGQVPPELEGSVSQQETRIKIAKRSYLKGRPCGWFTCGTRTTNLSFMALYYGTVPDPIPPPWWFSNPVLYCQGELLGICDEPHPAYDCVIFDWPSVQCRVHLNQTVYNQRLERIAGPASQEIVLLDNPGALAIRKYPPQNLQSLSPHAFILPENGIIIIITVSIEIQLEGNYTYLYFSSRCDSDQFLIELPNSYTLTYEPPPD